MTATKHSAMEFGETFGQCQGPQTMALVESLLKNVHNRIWYRDGDEIATTVKCTDANCCHGCRKGQGGEAVTLGERTLANAGHTRRYRDGGELGASRQHLVFNNVDRLG